MTALAFHYYYYHHHHHNYCHLRPFIKIFKFQTFVISPLVIMFSCYIYHRFSPSVSEFTSNTLYSTNPDRIAKRLLCVPYIDVTKHQLTTLTFICSLLFQTNHTMHKTYIFSCIYIYIYIYTLKLFHISLVVLQVSIQLHHHQGDLNLSFAKATKFLILHLSKISRLKCSRDIC